ncbi:hypothetical protein B0H17DRAFT_1128001 [Mycena rosella]|uniref:Uncharacterized protein n=1 Tax=Mycena rosella TaxID=1033263 RepID=A0AAD7GMA3_MYCRO|nr:hypothetical protein B0H17DRAFT_1128001 [Mycena rosella]
MDFTMLDHYLAELWSIYTISPKPLSCMQSLQQTCVALTKHFLTPCDIVLTGGRFMLHPNLTTPLVEIVPAMDHLLHHAVQYHGLSGAPFIGQSDLQVLTGTTAMHPCATQSQIVLAWVTLVNRLWEAMHELEGLCIGSPFDPSRHAWASKIPHIASALPLTLCTKLPKAFLEFFEISTIPLSDRAASIARKATLDPSNIMDCGDWHRAGQFGLEARSLISVENTVREMQLELTKTSDQATCFLVDPHRELLQALCGTSSVGLFPVAWEALSKRMGLAQVPLAQYHAGSIATHERASAPLEATDTGAGGRRKVIVHQLSQLTTALSSTCAARHDVRLSVKAMVAAIEAKESISAPREYSQDATTTSNQQSDTAQLEICTFGALTKRSLVNKPTTTCNVCASRCANMELRTAGVRSKSCLNDHKVEDAVITPSIGVLEFPATALVRNEATVDLGVLQDSYQQLGISHSEVRTLETLASPASFQSSAPANPVVNPTTVELGGLDKELCAQPESIAACIDTRLTAASTIPNTAHAARAPSPWIPAPVLVFNKCMVELGGPKHSPSAEDGQVTAPCTEGVSADMTPLLGILQSPAPAVMRNEAVEHGGLKESCQQLMITNLEMHTLERTPHTSDSPPPTRHMSALAARTSNTPALAPVFNGGLVELGGLKRRPPARHQCLATWCAEPIRTSTQASLAHPLLLPLVFSSASGTGIIALISTIIWSFFPWYLVCIARGELVPCMTWEWEVSIQKLSTSLPFWMVDQQATRIRLRFGPKQSRALAFSDFKTCAAFGNWIQGTTRFRRMQSG